jgi:hypothetical protein
MLKSEPFLFAYIPVQTLYNSQKHIFKIFHMFNENDPNDDLASFGRVTFLYTTVGYSSTTRHSSLFYILKEQRRKENTFDIPTPLLLSSPPNVS